MAWEPLYISLDDFKHYLRISEEDVTDDTELLLAITGASRAVDKCCSDIPNGLGYFRQFGLVDSTEPRYYTPRWDAKLIRWVIEIDDLMTTTGLQIFIDTTNDNNHNQQITNYVLRPQAAITENRPWTQIAISHSSTIQPTYFTDSAKVTARWGWTTVPDTIELATQIQAHRFFKRRTAPFGVTGSNTSRSNREIPTPAQVDPDVEAMLYPYRRLGWTV